MLVALVDHDPLYAYAVTLPAGLFAAWALRAVFRGALPFKHLWKRLWVYQVANYAVAWTLSRTQPPAPAADAPTPARLGRWLHRATCAGSGCDGNGGGGGGGASPGGAPVRDGYHAACFYTCAWCLAQLLCGLFKARAGRRRPIHALKRELCHVRRRLAPYVCVGLASGRNAIESFPSGDSAGGGVFAAALWRCARAPVGGAPLCWAFALAAGFGRMFFHAHHALDVAAGAALGAASTLALDAALGGAGFGGGGGGPGAGWRAVGFVHVLAAFAAFWCLYKCLQLLHPPQAKRKRK